MERQTDLPASCWNPPVFWYCAPHDPALPRRHRNRHLHDHHHSLRNLHPKKMNKIWQIYYEINLVKHFL